jgi:hypothetical protein
MREVFYQLLTQEDTQPPARSGCREEMTPHEMNIERQIIRVMPEGSGLDFLVIVAVKTQS